MGRTEGRTAADTQRLILTAAAEAIRNKGLVATLDEIAALAGVSKGGLLYHFPSKQALLAAMGEDLNQRFRQEVLAALDPADTRPGRLARAYIQVSLADVADSLAMRDNVTLAAHLVGDASLRLVFEADGHQWREDLAGDGLSPRTVRIIIATTDGVSTGPLWGSILTHDDIEDLRDFLTDLTLPDRSP